MGERAYLDHNRDDAAAASRRGGDGACAPDCREPLFHSCRGPRRARRDRPRPASGGGRRRRSGARGDLHLRCDRGAGDAAQALARHRTGGGRGAVRRVIRPMSSTVPCWRACNSEWLGAPNDADGVVRPEALKVLLAEPGGAIVALQAARTAKPASCSRSPPSPPWRGRRERWSSATRSRPSVRSRSTSERSASMRWFSPPIRSEAEGRGAPWVLNGDRLAIAEAAIGGGGQEMRRRSGTENVAGIVGMGAAAEAAVADLSAESLRLEALRDRLLAGLRAVRPDLVVFARGAPRLPNTLNVGVPGLRSPRRRGRRSRSISRASRRPRAPPARRARSSARMCSTPWASRRRWPRARCAFRSAGRRRRRISRRLSRLSRRSRGVRRSARPEQRFRTSVAARRA